MDSQSQQAAERIKQANNILVTVSNNPSVDQLAACIGLTLSLNKMDKHATAVFSGAVPSTLEFLQPEKTLEKNTDSLRDFIIALDKSKADKLRYKVEDRVVKIFITPYKTSINEKDLEFSQGDFNVDVVLAIGVHSQAELDEAITVHGRILHDATIITLNTKPGGELGSINWLDPNASSLSELCVLLVNALDKKLLDGQIATAFLTGLVAETERFSNGKTSPQAMSIGAELMSAGANQQLVATKLEEPVALASPKGPIAQQAAEMPKSAEIVPVLPPKPDDGTLEIAHDSETTSERSDSLDSAVEEQSSAALPQDESVVANATQPDLTLPVPPMELPAEPESSDEPAEEALAVAPSPPPQIHIDEHGSVSSVDQTEDTDEKLAEALLPPKSSEPPTISHHSERLAMGDAPAAAGGTLDVPSGDTTTSGAENSHQLDGFVTPPSDLPDNAPGTTFIGEQLVTPGTANTAATPPGLAPAYAPEAGETLSDIERDVHAHVAPEEPSGPVSQPPTDPVLIDPPQAPALPTEPTVPAAPQPLNVIPPPPPAAAYADPGLAVPTTPFPAPQAPVMTPDPAFTSPPVPEVAPPEAASPEVLPPSPTVDDARDAVAQALNGALQAGVPTPAHEEIITPSPTLPQPWNPPSDDSAVPANPPPLGPPPMMPA